MSNNHETERRKQLARQHAKMMEMLNSATTNSTTDTSDQLEQTQTFAEKLRTELQTQLEYNEQLWTEKRIAQRYNEHLKKTIDEHQDLLKMLKQLTEEDDPSDD
ncbi:hypothetical protein RDWZM_001339 [Blomia tropicalis]|uniref:Uncharacterized protein n=1 Tax=Blomia tropicalis TaxID=40697 RepID=A0A9Q0MBT5_BLOTA|nr:hypothetical protein BLOT_007348 [Blomia tropicalis]KAJ6222794.1 hypothetical protein RDWZM_001339 [Blomia tropicalis]